MVYKRSDISENFPMEMTQKEDIEYSKTRIEEYSIYQMPE